MNRLILPLLTLMLSIAPGLCRAEEPNTEQPSHGYSSPREAFDAMQNATAKRDWRTVFFSLTPASRDFVVFEVFYACLYHDKDAKVLAAMKKYGVENGKVWAEYTRNYREKHGVDLDKLHAEAEKRTRERIEKYLKKHPNIEKGNPNEALAMPGDPGEEPEPSGPPLDDELLSKSVLGLVTDKAAFYEEVKEAVTPKVKDILEPDYGDLKGLTVSGNTATGWITKTIYCLHKEPGKADVREGGDPFRVKRCFCNLDGRWYNEPKDNED